VSPVEQWKDVPGYAGLYQVSDQGRVRALVKRNTKFRSILRPSARPDGYLNVGLYGTDGRTKSFLVHRLVLTAFRGEAPAGMQGAHLSGIRSDNRLANLVWATVKENHGHKKLHGTAGVGEKNAAAKLDEATVLAIRREYVPRSKTRGAMALGKKYGTSFQNVWSIATGKNWSHLN
jgi:hypothetical protein